ncbi:MAG: hypothetical protein WCD47_09890 [Candidatus Sulfotelmatobacter sp.]
MKKIDWSVGARADVRRIDRKMAMRIFTTIRRFAETGEGDVKELKGESGELRLRVRRLPRALHRRGRRYDSNSCRPASARRLSVTR